VVGGGRGEALPWCFLDRSEGQHFPPFLLSPQPDLVVGVRAGTGDGWVGGAVRPGPGETPGQLA
jgi:hypothetical protein